MKEEWKDIKGYEGLYQISNFGRIRSSVWTLTHRNGKQYKREGRVLSYHLSHNGYLRVGLSIDKKQKGYFVHRLVYEAFNGPIPEGFQVNHINEVKTDNRPENLNLMTPKENSNWGTGKWRGGKKRKKPITQCLLDGTEVFTYFSAKDAEADTNIPNSNIIHCCQGKRTKAGGYKWKYA